MALINLEQLRLQEVNLPNLRFRYERSPLCELNTYFPPIDGKDFRSWVRHHSEGGRLLEVGGGINQTAALEILTENQGLGLFVAIEPRPLSHAVRRDLERVQSYHLVEAGISQLAIGKAGMEQNFDIVFAHFVAEHLPQPFDLLSFGLRTLRPGGVFFCNRLPAYRENLAEVVESIRSQGGEVELGYTPTESEVVRQGAIYTNLSVRVGSGDIVLPHINRTPLLTYGPDSRDTIR